MKAKSMKWFGSVAVVALPLLSGRSQIPSTPEAAAAADSKPAAATASVAAVTLPAAPAKLQPNVSEVVKLAQSGVGDDVVIAFVKNSRTPYNLSANDILALKGAGLSSPVVAAMLNRDSWLRSKRVQPIVPQPSNPPKAGAAAQGTKPYTYEQELYAPSPDAAPQPPPALAPVRAAPAQPVLPEQPVTPGQPVLPAQPAIPG